MSEFTLSSIPGRLQWQNHPLEWDPGDRTRLTITASELTDLFIDPSGSGVTDNLSRAMFVPPDPSFQLTVGSGTWPDTSASAD